MNENSNGVSRVMQITLLGVLLWLAAVGISYYWNDKNIYTQIVALAEVDAKTNLKRDLAFRLWATSHGGIYLRVDENTQPNSFLSHVPERDVPIPGGGMLTMQNPAATLREIKEMQSSLYGELSRITSMQYLNPNNAPDEWEKKALGIVAKTRQDFGELTRINGRVHFRMMQPTFMEQDCLKCHAWTGIAEGGLRGGTDIAIPLDRYDAVSNSGHKSAVLTHVWVLLFGWTAIGFMSFGSLRYARESMRYQQELQELAQLDPLTGLFNRRSFFNLAAQELARCHRMKVSFSMMMIDIDLFKRINDAYGHDNGDKVLQKLSAIFRNEVRTIDIVCRLGGEEFVILLPETCQPKAVEMAERLRVTIADAEIPLENEAPIQFRVSIGVASLGDETDTVDAVLRRADSALYQAKKTGRNRVCVFDGSRDASSLHTMPDGQGKESSHEEI